MPTKPGARTEVSKKTVDNYVAAACDYIRAAFGYHDLRLDQWSGRKVKEYSQLLGRFGHADPHRVIRAASAFEELQSLLRTLPCALTVLYIRWAIIALFLGLRGSEFLESPYNVVHPNLDGSSKALLRSDISFTLLPLHSGGPLTLADIRASNTLFRYQKNADNGISRQLEKSGHPFFCGVVQFYFVCAMFDKLMESVPAARRGAYPLAVDEHGVQLTVAGMEQMLKRAAAVHDPATTAAKLKLVTVHSLRIGALKRALAVLGAIIELTCFFLRWKSDAYVLYLRSGSHNHSSLAEAEQELLQQDFLADASADDGAVEDGLSSLSI